MIGHVGVASLMNEEAWKLSPREADAYTGAVSEFLRWHVPSFQAGGKRGSEIALIVTMGMIYLPKAAFVFAKKRGMIGHNGGPSMDAPAAPVSDTIN